MPRHSWSRVELGQELGELMDASIAAHLAQISNLFKHNVFKFEILIKFKIIFSFLALNKLTSMLFFTELSY